MEEGEQKPYIDLLMGYSSTNFGHANDDILKFVKEAIEKFDNITSFNSRDKIELTEKLINLLPHPGRKLVYYPVGGTKAIDAAIKLAFTFTKKQEVIRFDGAFHGYSFTGMSITDKKYVDKKQYGKSAINVKSFPFPNKLHITEEESLEILKDIENYLRKNNKRVAAVIIEPIQGAAGFLIPPKSFLVGLDKLTKKYKVIFICDEIQIGLCRTGSFYYINQINIDPDIVLLGKSLAGGYYPISAVIGRRELFESIPLDGSGFDSTFANNPLGLRIANKIIDFMSKKKINKRVEDTGKKFLEKLQELNKYPFVKDISGIGMAFSYRIESPENTISTNAKLAKKIKKEAFINHLIIQTAGVNADYIKLSPSFFISDQEIGTTLVGLNKVMEIIAPSL